MKLRKFSTGSLIKSQNKNKNNILSKKSGNNLFNKQKSQNPLNLPKKKNSCIHLNKRAITSSNLNFIENKIKYKHNNKNVNSNSQKSLKSKSNSDLKSKTDIGLNINSPNSSMNIFLNKKNIKLELNKKSLNRYKVRSLSKHFSSRNFDGKANSFEYLKLSNEDILSNKNNKNKKFNDSLKSNNKLKLSQFSKNKSNFYSCTRINYKLYNKKNKNNKERKKYNNICGLLSKKNKLKNQIINFSALLDKYLYDSSNIKIYQNEKENININSNNNKNQNHYKCNKLILSNNNNFSNKNKRNINRRGMYQDYQTKLTQPKHSTKKKINLPKHPNSKIINTEINQINQYFSRKNINLTESNIQLDKRSCSRIKKDDNNTSKILVPINLKKKNSYHNINNKNNNIFTEDFLNDYFENEFSKNKQNYEGVEVGHFNIVKLIQENKKRILEQNQ